MDLNKNRERQSLRIQSRYNLLIETLSVPFVFELNTNKVLETQRFLYLIDSCFGHVTKTVSIVIVRTPKILVKGLI